MFDAKASQPDVEIDFNHWLNLRIRMTAMPKPRAVRDSVVMPSIRSREIAWFRRKCVGEDRH